MFNTEIQDGRPILQENNLGEKLPVYSADTLGVKNFSKITLSHTVSKINTFF